jgi:dTDP-4-amino-4,6-dideoxygalactose transaminase
MKQIPFFTLLHQNLQIEDEVQQFYKRLHAEAWYILGVNLEQFEKEYSEYSSVKHAVGVGNGLDALTISLKALNIGKGDEVIVPANTFIATILAVTHAGGTPILIDPDPFTYNITAKNIEDKISSKTKAVIPVHLYGSACAMDDILDLAKKHSIHVIEDNAQAHGAEYNGKKTGSFGIINATSFYPVKPLGAYGDGGAITTNDDVLAQKVKLLRNYGSDEKYYYETTGFNSRLDELQAGILSIKLKHLERWNEERIQLAHHYSVLLKDVGDIIIPQEIKNSKHVYHLYVIQTDKRNQLKEFLKKHGIETGIHYPVPAHLQKAYDFLQLKKGSLPITETLSDKVLSLPLYNGMKREETEYVCEVIKKFYI